MNTEKAYKVLQKVARQKGITVEQVIHDIDFAIADAWERSNQENNIAAIQEWQNIPSVGSVPTAVELVAYLGEKVWKEKKTKQRWSM